MKVKINNSSQYNIICYINDMCFNAEPNEVIDVTYEGKSHLSISLKCKRGSYVEKINKVNHYVCSILSTCEFDKLTESVEFVITYEKIKLNEENLYYERLFVNSADGIKTNELLQLVDCDSFYKKFKREIKEERLKESLGFVISYGIGAIVVSGINFLLIAFALVYMFGVYNTIKILLFSILAISLIIFFVDFIGANLYEKFSEHGKGLRLKNFKKYLTNEYIDYYYNEITK